MTTQIDERQIENKVLTYASFRDELGYWDETKNYSAGDIVRWKGKLYKATTNIDGNAEGDLSHTPDVSHGWVLVFDPGSSLVRKVNLLSDTNIDLAQTVSTIDGVSVSPGMTVFLAGQTDKKENGYYYVTSGFTLLRPSELSNGANLDGTAFFVMSGNTYAKSFWIVETTGAIPDGEITAVRVSSGGTSGSYTFTNGLTESSGVVKLGGVLDENTNIDNCTNNVEFSIGKIGGTAYRFDYSTNTHELHAVETAGSSTLTVMPTYITLQQFDGSDIMKVVLDRMNKIIDVKDYIITYNTDYSSRFNDRTITDKGYVDFRSHSIVVTVLADDNVNPDNAPLTIDNYTLQVGDLVALFNENTPDNDGIYIVTNVGNSNTTLERWNYVPVGFELGGYTVSVLQGDTHKNKLYFINYPAKVGHDNITYYKVGAVNYTFWNGLVKDSNNRVGLGGYIEGNITVSLDNESGSKYSLTFEGQSSVVSMNDYLNRVVITAKATPDANIEVGAGGHIIVGTTNINISLVDKNTGVPSIIDFENGSLEFYVDRVRYSGPKYSSNVGQSYWIPDKMYVDSHSNIITVEVRTTGDIDIHNPPHTIDGVSVYNGMVIGVFDQSNHGEEGIYKAQVSGSTVHLYRHYSFPSGEHLKHKLVYVVRGNTHGGKIYRVTNTNNASIGTDDIHLAEYSSGGSNLPSDNITGTGTATQIAFFSGDHTLSSDSNLFWDNSNKRLGINTSSPSTGLHLVNDSITLHRNITSGNANFISMSNQAEDPAPGLNILYYKAGIGNTPAGTWALRISNSGRPVAVNYFDDPILWVSTDKKIGINTTSPQTDLDVHGTTRVSNNIIIGTTSSALTPTQGIAIRHSSKPTLFDIGTDSSFVLKYNATAGDTGEEYVVNDKAIKLVFGLDSNTMTLFNATTGTAGNNIDWTELLNVNDNEITFKGSPLITLDIIENGYNEITASNNLAENDYAIAVFKENGPVAGYAKIFIKDESSGWCGILHAYKSDNIYTIWFENSMNASMSLPPITKFYVKAGSYSSDGAIIYATVSNANNSFSIRLLNTNIDEAVILKNFVVSGTDPGDVNYSNIVGITNECIIPQPGTGFTLGRDIYIGYPTAYKVLTEGDINTKLDNRYVNVDGDTMTGTLIMSSSNVQINDAKLLFHDSSASRNLTLQRNSSGQLQIVDSGLNLSLSIGSVNSDWCHFNTAAPRFYFNKDITTGTGTFSAYSGKDLELRLNTQPVLFADHNTHQVGIATTSPTEQLDVAGWVRGDRGFTVDRRVFTIAQDTAPTYYRIGEGKSRCSGMYLIRYQGSGKHGEILFIVGDNFNSDIGYGFTLLYNSFYSDSEISKIRFAEASTYDDMYVDVYIANDASTALTVEVIQLTKGDTGFDMPTKIEPAPSLGSGYTGHEFLIYGKQFVTKDFYVDNSGIAYASSYFQPGVSYKSSDGSVGVNATLNLLSADKTTAYTLVIKDGLVTQVSSTTLT